MFFLVRARSACPLPQARGTSTKSKIKQPMKVPKKLIIFYATVALCTGASFAQDEQPSYPKGSATPDPTASGAAATQPFTSRSQQFVKASKLIGKSTKNAQGQDLGKLSEVPINPHDGQIFALIDVGGSRYAPVPWQLLDVLFSQRGDQNVVVNTTKELLSSAPTITDRHWSSLNSQGFTQKLNPYYNVQPPSAVGGTGVGQSGSMQGTNKMHRWHHRDSRSGSGTQQQQPAQT